MCPAKSLSLKMDNNEYNNIYIKHDIKNDKLFIFFDKINQEDESIQKHRQICKNCSE